MGIDFYYLPGSSPCRAVQMTAKAVGVDLNLKLLDLMAGEHMKPEFLKLNPQHCIPTLDDNGFSLWESRAIQIYLVEKYGKDDSLYPKDPKVRGVINQRMYFDMGTLYSRFGDYWYPHLFAKAPLNPDNFKKMEEAVEFLNTFLDGHKWVVGNHMTVADIALVATISSYEVSGFDFSKYPNVQKWFAQCKSTMPGYDINQAGLNEFKKYFN